MKYLLLLLLLVVPQLDATTYTVINTGDSGPGSLRDAITSANLDVTPPTIINFNIPGVGPQVITPTTFFFTDPSNIQSWVYPPITQTMTMDGTTQSGYTIGNQQIVIDFSVVAATENNGNGFTILGADNCVIKGLLVENYVGMASGRGISIQNTITNSANGNRITQCRCGSYTLFGNTRAIVIDGRASTVYPIMDTIIGGPSAEDANVLSGNAIEGLVLEFNVYNSTIQNNFIGCDKTGTVAVGNAFGILLTGNASFPCNDNLIIDNVISGNSSYGVILQDNSNNNIIQNNKIGTEITGTAALGSMAIGILLANDPGLFCTGNLIGGSGPNQGNIISGNQDSTSLITTDLVTSSHLTSGLGMGIYMNDNVNTSTIIGNLIGTDITGTHPIPNSYGIYIQGDPSLPCVNNSIGGSVSGAGNVIAFNTAHGIVLNTNVLDSVIQGNFIGTDVSGTLPQGNGASGIFIQGAGGNPCTGNLIGGTTEDEKNIITNNGSYGVEFSGDPTTPDVLNAIIGNSIYNNNGNGINLTNNANDLQEGPTLEAVGSCCDESQLSIRGVAPVSPAASNFRLEFFTNPTNTSPITEGKQLIGVVPSIPSGQSFLYTFTGATPFTPGSFVSATATNLNNAGNPGDTSEFTSSFTIVPLTCPDTTLTANTTDIAIGQSALLTATITGSGPFSIVWSDGFMQSGITSTATHTVSPIVTTTYYATVTDTNGCTMVSDNDIVIRVECPLLPFEAEKIFCFNNGQLILGRRGKNRILLQQRGNQIVESSFYAAPITDTFVGPVTLGEFETMVDQGCTCN